MQSKKRLFFFNAYKRRVSPLLSEVFIKDGFFNRA